MGFVIEFKLIGQIVNLPAQRDQFACEVVQALLFISSADQRRGECQRDGGRQKQ